jgi:hypothetical protein
MTPNEENAANLNVNVASVLDATIERILSSESTRYVTISYITVAQNFMVFKNFITFLAGHLTTGY